MKSRESSPGSREMSRRSFLQAAGAGALGTGLGLPAATHPLLAAQDEKQEKKLEWRNRKDTMKYRRLGRTNFMVSEITYGTTITNRDNVDLILEAGKLGVNLIDTARGYARGAAEKAIGDTVLKKHRDDYFIITKGPGNARGLLRSVDRSLEALGTDIIDVMMIHGVSSARALDNDELIDAFRKLKKDGKIRFTGISSHTNVVESLEAAAGSGHFDVLLGAISVLNDDTFKNVFKLVKEKDLGFLAMKTAYASAWKRRHVERGKYSDGDLYEEVRKRVKVGNLKIYQACYRWALDLPGVASVLSPMRTKKMIEENLQVPFLEC